MTELAIAVAGFVLLVGLIVVLASTNQQHDPAPPQPTAIPAEPQEAPRP